MFSDKELDVTKIQFLDEVLGRGTVYGDDQVMDSIVFQRGVYYMKGFDGFNGSIFDRKMGRFVNCTLINFQGTDLYNVSGAVLDDPLTADDNNTFMCMSPWPNGTSGFQAEGTHVKCMPQNSKYGAFVLRHFPK